MATYGATVDQMASSAESRRQDWVSEALGNPSVALDGAPEMAVHEHTFRDRQTHLEIGPEGNFSGRKYVPRAYYSGGGKLNRPKTREFHSLPSHDQRRAVSALDPRVATPSVVDVGTVRGRVQQAPFDERLRFQFRRREAAKELHAPMYYKAKNDMERVNNALDANTMNDSGAWEEASKLTFRTASPHKWQGTDFRATTAPARNEFASLDGSRFDLSTLASEPAVTSLHSSTGSLRMVKDNAFTLRARERRDLDLGAEFATITKRGGRDPASPTRVPYEFREKQRAVASRPYHKSLTAVPSTLDY